MGLVAVREVSRELLVSYVQMKTSLGHPVILLAHVKMENVTAGQMEQGSANLTHARMDTMGKTAKSHIHHVMVVTLVAT